MVDGTKQFCEFNAFQQHFTGEICVFFIVCNEPTAIMWHFLKNIIFFLFIMHALKRGKTLVSEGKV